MTITGTRTHWTRVAPTAAAACGSRSRSTAAMVAVGGRRRHPHRLAGGARRRRAPALRRRLDRAGAVRRLARLAPRRRPAHLRLPALGGARGARQRAAARRRRARRRDRRDRPPRRPAGDRRRRRPRARALSASPATSPRASCSPAAGARTSTSRAPCATASPTRSARSGVVLAGAFVLAGGSPIVDPIVGLVIAALVLASSWRLIKEPVEVLMEAAPEGLDVDSVGEAICAEQGVRSVHDLHVWTRDPRLRGARRPRRRRRRLGPRPDPRAASRSSSTSASRSTTPRCRWRRRPPPGLLEVERTPPEG